MEYLVDTTFLIHRWREGAAGPEQRFIDSHRDSEVGIPWVVKGEFLRGAVLAGHPPAEVREFLDRYRVAWPDDETLSVYAAAYAALFRSRQLIGPHDIWIAACALRVGLPLLTRNVHEFRRVVGLEIHDYSA